MKTLIAFFIFFLIFSCQKDNSSIIVPDQDNIIFDYSSFMQQTTNEIAFYLAEILKVHIDSSVTEITPQNWPVGLAGHPWVTKGYKFEVDNGATIIIWVDENDNKIYVTYLLRRFGSYDSHSFEIEKIDSTFNEILPQIGIDLDGTEIYSNYKAKVRDWSDPDNYFHFYRISLYQTFNNMQINTPNVECEIDGFSGKINYLKFGKWYNIHSEVDCISNDSLLARARTIYQNQNDIISIPDSLNLYGYYFKDDCLCQRIGYSIFDQWGSQRYLFLDIFNAELLCIENLYMD